MTKVTRHADRHDLKYPSLQPARLVIALLMVVALINFGRVWDGVTSPSVAPPVAGGLNAHRWDSNGPESREQVFARFGALSDLDQRAVRETQRASLELRDDIDRRLHIECVNREAKLTWRAAERDPYVLEGGLRIVAALCRPRATVTSSAARVRARGL